MMATNLPYIVNHLFLPPKLPFEDDVRPKEFTTDKYQLGIFVESAMRSYHPRQGQEEKFEHAQRMLDCFTALRSEENEFDPELFIDELRELKDGGLIALHVEAQNAGIIIKRVRQQVVFHTFEASASNAEIIGCKGRLSRKFPGTAISIDFAEVTETFCDQLATFIARVDSEVPPEALMKAKKAGKSDIVENRDSTVPMFVTEMLTGILRGIGQEEKVVPIYKHVRDDIIDGGGLLPWRRSPLWLVMRVALQTALHDPNSPAPLSHLDYKLFMLHLFANAVAAGCKDPKISSELLYIMNVKLARRVQKLAGNIPEGLLNFVQTVCTTVRTNLDNNWRWLENPPRLNWDPSQINPARDTSLTLEQLTPYLQERVKTGLPRVDRGARFEPNCARRIELSWDTFPTWKPEEIDRLLLADLEKWIATCASTWAKAFRYYDNVPQKLATLYDFYAENGRRLYEGFPEDMSVMVLTLMHLWTILDSSTALEYPFILKYPIPFLRLDALILPKMEQLKQLADVKEYISARKKRVVPGYPSPFSKDITKQSLSVEFYRFSSEARLLRIRIDANTAVQKANKISQYEHARRQYDSLMDRAARSDHKMYTNRLYGYTKHCKFCGKCKMEKQAKEITIEVYEEPLPQDEIRRQAAVAEICMPQELSRWRDITFEAVVDITASRRMKSPDVDPKGVKKQQIYTALDYEGFSNFKSAHKGRVLLASHAKPFSRSHYGRSAHILKFNESTICVPNGLQYSMYFSNNSWEGLTEDFLPTGECPELRKSCTPRVESKAYQSLAHTIADIKHTTNEIIATQNKCSNELTLHEYYEFGALRAGHRLQWRNIAREIAAQVLNFNAPDVHTLIVQAAWQVGPSDDPDVIPESHKDLGERAFALELMDTIRRAVEGISSNWRGVSALRTYIALAARIVDFDADDQVTYSGYELLQDMCRYAVLWTRVLSEKLEELGSESTRHEPRNDAQKEKAKSNKKKKDEELKELSLWIMETAMTALQIFNIGGDHISNLLEDDEIASMAIEMAIVAHDNLPSDISEFPHTLKTLVNRHHRNLYSLETHLRETIQYKPNVLDAALSHVWEAYTPVPSWTVGDDANDRWIISKTESYFSAHQTRTHQVCVNLLTGELLVNGEPLARLPREYTEHPDFKRLFGQRILQVSPPEMHDMKFTTRSFVEGHKVSFRMLNEQLIIRSKSHSIAYEYIPHTAFSGDFTRPYIEGYVHWLNLQTYTVEFRKIGKPWDTRPTLQLAFYDSYQFYGGRLTECASNTEIIDIHSATARQISAVLKPLETLDNMSLKYDRNRGLIYIDLDRYSLNFLFSTNTYGRPKRITCKNYTGLYIDEDQSIGTLTGLNNKLVLKNDRGDRSVLIPHGTVSFIQTQRHVKVDINIQDKPTVHCHKYNVNTQLGRLIGSGSLLGQLYKVYLHALTSHVLPDRLTGRTGTEEALYQLDSAATRSFQELSDEEQKLLVLIAKLSPERAYYPAHLKVMQQVSWNDNLPQLSQHPRFIVLVKSILEYAQSLQIFRENPEELPEVEYVPHLQMRAAKKDTVYYSDGFSDYQSRDFDEIYFPREASNAAAREARVCRIVRLTKEWSRHLNVKTDLLDELQSWKKPISGPYSSAQHLLGFEWSYLGRYSEFMPVRWCTLQVLLSSASEALDKHKIMFFLSALAYSQYADENMIDTLLSFATIPGLRVIGPPEEECFDLSCGFKPTFDRLYNLVKEHHVEYSTNSPEYSLARTAFESESDYLRRKKRAFDDTQAQKSNAIVDAIHRSWPGKVSLSEFTYDYYSYVDVNAAIKATENYTSMCKKNKSLREHLNLVEFHLRHVKSAAIYIEQFPMNSHRNFDPLYERPTAAVELKALLQGCASPPSLGLPLDMLSDLFSLDSKVSVNHTKLDDLLNRIEQEINSNGSSLHEKEYINDLRASFKCLQTGGQNIRINDPSASYRKEDIARNYRNMCNGHVNMVLERIKSTLCAPKKAEDEILQGAGLWPRIAIGDLLGQLSSNSYKSLPVGWRRTLLNYGKSLAALQRSERVLENVRDFDDLELATELQNPGHSAWDVSQYPEWLLLELENNILIRPAQCQTAKEMMYPQKGGNSVMQLNMGEGKTSVIVPIIASAMADGSRLVRVVVLRPLAKQMFRLLVRKLGGLLNRRVFYMPFNRKLDLDVPKAQQIRRMYEECMRCNGILLVQPEHMLSFKLMGFERMFAGKTELGLELVATQSWLDENSRDILDESDEILNIKFELVYAIGTQRNVEFSPDRWKIILDIMESVRWHAPSVHREFPEGLELSPGVNGCFRRVRIIHPAAGKRLIEKVSNDICLGAIERVAFRLNRDEMWKFITETKLDRKNAARLKKAIDSSQPIWNTLLLLKGLVAGGVLDFALSKRWRVNYGLDPSRTMLAVPYRAKDCPVSRAEFSHTDSTIVLTALSYYYDGLTDEQLFICVEHLLALDFCEEEYARWVSDAPRLDKQFRTHHGINLRNQTECTEKVFPNIRLAKAVIDFYLVHFVFPKELKEYPNKLSASGWDIACTKRHPTTGFSGTNDSRYVLPLSVSQTDLPQQQHTNATVLNCILWERNSYLNLFSEPGAEFDAKLLLDTVAKQDIRVVIDVGAQILEMSNRDVAHYWLFEASKKCPFEKPKAVVYFEDNDELSVLTKANETESFMLSPFAQQLDKCLVYLDEIHTRGTDLKLPSDYKAAVTLGPGLTKDRLVQACMRMRKLGKNQSVVFCAPGEVQRSIRELKPAFSSSAISVSDVLRWTIAETCRHTRKSIPLWAHQGLRYQQQSSIRQKWQGNITGEKAQQLLEKESKTLHERYGDIDLHGDLDSQNLEPMQRQHVDAIKRKCDDFNLHIYGDVGLEEEQERELSPENEREIEIQRPPRVDPSQHTLHQSVYNFVVEGTEPPSASAPAFSTLASTTLGALANSAAWPSSLLATNDFTLTVKQLTKPKAKQNRDFYLRPVNWVLSSTLQPSLKILVSPYEANALIPTIRKSAHVTLHTYSPRVSRSAARTDTLSQFTIGHANHPFKSTSAESLPPSIPLNIFAGQLYFSSREEYLSFCAFLGISAGDHGKEVTPSIDGFINALQRQKVGGRYLQCGFSESPVGFVGGLAAARRKGLAIERSHVGRVCRGGILGENENFDF